MRTRIDTGGLRASEGTWERQYFEYLSDVSRWSPEARIELRSCTDRVFEKIPPPDRERSGTRSVGVVVGAIQSGKTALMISLAAKALDLGYRLVLVLGGLRDDLRTQTALRFTSELLQRGDLVYPKSDQPRYTHKRGAGYHGTMKDCWSSHYASDVTQNEAFLSTIGRKARAGQAILIVTKKNVATLNRARDAVLYASESLGPGKLPILVLDDECDEASVSGIDDAPTPERIVEIWGDVNQYVTYIGLTATPAANLLQDTESALFPTSPVRVFRNSSAMESAVTYLEPRVDRRYCGSQVFYRMCEENERRNVFLRCDMSDSEFAGEPGHDGELEEALIAYFVSGAIRLAVDSDRRSFGGTGEFPRPHTMLAHTEGSMQGHWDLCHRVVAITRRLGGRDTVVRDNLKRVKPSRRLSSADLENWLAIDPARWSRWYDEFCRGQTALQEILPDYVGTSIPEWPTVKAALAEVFANVQLRVINSDDLALDEPLDFHPTFSADGQVRPRDIYSIVIGGNRLSRGLTIEGLCISYYTRNSAVFSEDTTVQRERWFGYRGAHLEFCRLFTHRDLAIRLKRFHEHDDDLRRQLAINVAHGRSAIDATFRFLKLADSRPTSKLGRGFEGAIEISGARLFVDRVQMGNGEKEKVAASANQDHVVPYVQRVMTNGRSVFGSSGKQLAWVLDGVPALSIAEFLDGFRFTFHNPNPGVGFRFNLKEWHRQPVSELAVANGGLAPSSDPLLVAAYLRFWKYAYERCRGNPRANIFRAEDTVSDWIPCPAPTFNLAVRLGRLKPAGASPFNYPLLDREVSVSGKVGSRWGGRGAGGFGDEWIDMAPPDGNVDATRDIGTAGLVLLQVISREAKGLEGVGCTYEFDRPMIGVIVPVGGPCIQFVVTNTAPCDA